MKKFKIDINDEQNLERISDIFNINERHFASFMRDIYNGMAEAEPKDKIDAHATCVKHINNNIQDPEDLTQMAGMYYCAGMGIGIHEFLKTLAESKDPVNILRKSLPTEIADFLIKSIIESFLKHQREEGNEDEQSGVIDISEDLGALSVHKDNPFIKEIESIMNETMEIQKDIEAAGDQDNPAHREHIKSLINRAKVRTIEGNKIAKAKRKH